VKNKSSILLVRGERHLPGRLNKLALAAAFAALILIIILIVTFVSADKMMRIERKPLAGFASNIMPDYQLASFPSLDEQTRLSGWFFQTAQPATSTIILVHDNGNNRLQFDLDSPALFEFLISQNFNVLAFDLRNSGKSEGQLSTYGYAEWEDVLAAIKYVRQYSATSDVVLYGIGSGVSAALMAWQELPAAGSTENAESVSDNELGFDRGYIRAVILDTPAISPDEYIQADLREQGPLGRYLLQHTVPYAIRLSAGHARTSNLITIVSQMQIPVFATWCEPDSHISNESIQPFVDERVRLHPDTTRIFRVEKVGSGQGWQLDQAGYIQSLEAFLDRYVRPS
jgi:hypothetical protein